MPKNAPLAAVINAALLRVALDHTRGVARIRAVVKAYRERQITYNELREVLRVRS